MVHYFFLFLVVFCLKFWFLYFSSLINIFFRGGLEAKCLIGYQGPLCQTCSKLRSSVYSKKADAECKMCYNEKIEFILFLLIVVFFVIFYSIVVR